MLRPETGTVLYGMMGAGKTTLGNGLAMDFGQEFLDTDRLIEGHADMSCGDLIRQSRRRFEVVQALVVNRIPFAPPGSPRVVATGGSIASYATLTDHLSQVGVGIFLDVDPEELESRLPPEKIANLNNPDNLSFAALYERRKPAYEAAARYTLRVAAGEHRLETQSRLIHLRTTGEA